MRFIRRSRGNLGNVSVTEDPETGKYEGLISWHDGNAWGLLLLNLDEADCTQLHVVDGQHRIKALVDPCLSG